MSDPHFYSLSGPLDSMPSERQMRTANLSSFAELVRQYGADPRSILEQHGIDPRALRDPDFYIDCKSLVDVFEYCSTTFNDSLFGLRLDRNSVVSGKSVSVRVDLGGRRIIKKKKTQKENER